MRRYKDVPEPYIIEELEKLRREQEERPSIQLPLPPPPPPRPAEEKKSDRGVVIIQVG